MIRIIRYINGTLSQAVLYVTKVTPKLSDIVVQTGQVHLQIDAQLLGIVYVLVET